MSNYIKTPKGYFYKLLKNGIKKRVSYTEYETKNNKVVGGGICKEELEKDYMPSKFRSIFSKEDKESNNKIVANIKATQYPYVLDQDSLSLEQLIIRDADLLQGVRDDYHQQVIIVDLENMINAICFECM